MIKINDKFEFERADQCWELHEWRTGKNKDGEPTRTKSTTYHATILQVCKAVIDREAGAADSLQDLVDTINASTDDLEECITNKASRKET